MAKYNLPSLKGLNPSKPNYVEKLDHGLIAIRGSYRDLKERINAGIDSDYQELIDALVNSHELADALVNSQELIDALVKKGIDLPEFKKAHINLTKIKGEEKDSISIGVSYLTGSVKEELRTIEDTVENHLLRTVEDAVKGHMYSAFLKSRAFNQEKTAIERGYEDFIERIHALTKIEVLDPFDKEHNEYLFLISRSYGLYAVGCNPEDGMGSKPVEVNKFEEIKKIINKYELDDSEHRVLASFTAEKWDKVEHNYNFYFVTNPSKEIRPLDFMPYLVEYAKNGGKKPGKETKKK